MSGSKESSPFKHSRPNQTLPTKVAGVLKVVLLYAVFSSVYILLSDQMLIWLFHDPEQIKLISITKGWVFVAITSVLLFGLIRRQLRQGLEALQEREEAYRNLAEQSPNIIYQTTADNKNLITYISPKVSDLGYSPQEFIDTPEFWLHLIHPEDVERVLKALEQSRFEKTAFSSEYRMKTQLGEWRHFHDKSEVVRDSHGQALYVQGMLLDITERKHAEHELRVAATAFESQDAMVITDENQIILKINHAFTTVTGYSLEEAIGKTPAMLKAGLQDATFYKLMWESLGRDHYWQGEIWDRRKDGEVYPERLSITAVIGDNGKVTNYVASFTDITQNKKAEETIHNLAFYDALTGLPNRKLLLDRLKHALLSSSRKKCQGAMLFINLDDFKTLNDTRGHDIGDLLLIEVAQRIQSCIHIDDTLARLGSDEFAVLLDTLSTAQEQAALQAAAIAERIHKAIQQPFTLDGKIYYCKSCIGISLFHDHETSFEELLKRTDAALSQAKENGPDKIHFFDSHMQATLEARVNLESWLHAAIPAQLQLFYQAQVDKHGNAFGAEVLIRWFHPEKGIISPTEFIPLAEETGLILPIGRWVLETACRQIKAWETNAATRHLILAVNVSAKQFHQPDFVDQVLDVLNHTGADPTRLKLELTESLLLENVETIILKMTALKEKGVRFSLDDFGTGFSSLAYLKRLPLDQLKIDQSFVRDLNTDPNDASIVRTIISLGQSLGLEVIAEGVETEAQRNFLAVNGCTQYQGYLFSKPIPLNEFEKLLHLS
ncbi:cyclic di-GMP phosphodiesterase Gmr [mine drainage metagenome]|uniref:Cyclic di-GMP phosphodiesterase Gmr n=1 Tax=mine drainage metagenome TaxID=410659 RepID=A0A1J5SE40_9ZZZZ